MAQDSEQIAKIVGRRTEGRESDIQDDAKKLGGYGFARDTILKTLALKYDETGDTTLLDVPGIDIVRAGALIDAGYETPHTLATANIDEVEDIKQVGSGIGRAIVETSRIVLDESNLPEKLREETECTYKELVDLLRPIAAIGVPPSEATDDLVSVLSREPSIVNELGLDGRTAYNLERSDLGTVDRIAEASIDELTSQDYIGEQTANRIREAARDTSDNWGEEPGSNGAQKHDDSEDENDETDSTETEPSDTPGFELRLLLIGNARPNLEHGENAGIRIRAALESEGYDLDNFDAAIYSGYVSPTPHHESFSPTGCFEELNEQFKALATQLPLYYITGDYGEGDPLENVYDRQSYAPGDTYDPFTTAPTDLIEYIPIHDTVPLDPIQATQNPSIAAGRDDCLIVAPDLYPELWNDHEALAYIAGGQLPGRYLEDSIAPSYSMENVGPKRPDAAGAVHSITITDEGIQNHNLISLGDVTMISCPDHINRGLQFAHEGSGCLFCLNEDRFFEEWLKAGTRSYRARNGDAELGSALEYITDSGYFAPEQAEDFRTFADQKIYEDYLGQSHGEPTIGAGRETDSGLVDDPRDIYDEAVLFASEQLGIEPHERAAYFHQFDVTTTAETQELPFEEVQPPIPDGISEGHTELDHAAYDRNMLVGEWLFFPKRQVVGQVWRNVLNLVAEGLLYDAEVATAWHHQARSDHSKRYFLGVAVPNYFDVQDVHRVGKLLIEKNIVGDDQVLSFKPILYSKLGMHTRNASQYGIESSSRYTIRTLNQLSDA